MRSKIDTIIIVSIVVINLVLGILLVKNYKIYNLLRVDEDAVSENRIKIIDELRRLEISYEYSHISNEAKVRAPDNTMIPLASMVSSQNKLFFRIPEGVCNICYDSLYEAFNNMAKEMGYENLIILVPNNRLREMSLLFDGKQLNERIFGISTEELGLNIQGSYLPYFFVMDSTMISKNLHLPHKNEQTLTKYYLTTIQKRYFKNQQL